MKNFSSTFEHKLIYIFRINDEAHENLLKIGDATIHIDATQSNLINNCKELNVAAKARINSYTVTAGINYELLHTELAIKIVGGKTKAFRDKEVHSVLRRSGIGCHDFKTESKGREWFKVDLETAKKAIGAVKNSQRSLDSAEITNENSPIIFRPEQLSAIKQTLTQFKSSNRMLWNAKMRFGKTLSALEVAKKSVFKKVLIFTHRPVVSEGWFEDFNKIFYGTNYVFGSKIKGELIENLVDTDKPYVYFASMQDLRGSSAVGGKFDKNEFIFLIDWDFLIVDEAHEGTQTSLGQRVFEVIKGNSPASKLKVLELSGTPFNLLSNYKDNEIYSWDYIMEQRAKNDWYLSHFGDSNPYAELPKLEIFTYNLDKHISGYIDIEDSAFNFREFFRIWTGDISKDFKEMPADATIGNFVHKNDVQAFLNLITKTDGKSNFPFSTEIYRSYYRHTLWMVPGVKEAAALSSLLKSHSVFGSGAFEIVNVAGSGDEETGYRDALKAVREAIGDNPDEGYSITISCGRLTTGVTVPEWTAVLMLAGSFSTSASNYLQTIFRVQTPANINGKIKEHCSVFDFAPDRTLKMVAEAGQLSAKAGSVSSDRAIMGEFLNYCPVVSIDGTSMTEYNVDSMLQQLKKAYTDKVVKNGFDDKHIYNENLLKLDDLELNRFENLHKIVGSSKQAKKTEEVDINKQGFTGEEFEEIGRIEKIPKKERTPAETKFLEEKKKKKDNAAKAMSILRGISIRIPLMIYGAEVAIDKEITANNFVDIIDDASWLEFMPTGVTKDIFKEFSKYYEQDVFVAAGRQIRNIVLSADKLSPIERVMKIASQFAMFKNPDKETVLTPWRVVNMHLGDCLGGYNFYDDEYKTELDETRFIHHGRVTDETVLNTSAEILEINSKTGLYPLYVTHSIYRRRLETLPANKLTLEKQYELWDETVTKNLFIICKTPMAKAITKRTLMGYRQGKVNAHYFEDLINQIKCKPEQFRDKVIRSGFWNLKENKEMKFNAVVGNPPYQENIENRGEQPPVYHLFYDAAFLLSKKASLITPARFLFNVGKTPTQWNDKMINDKHFKVVKYFSNSKEIFDSVSIKGGVAITFRDIDENFGAIGTYTQNDTIKNILNKTEKLLTESLESIIFSNTSYKYDKSFFNENLDFSERVSGGSRRYLSSSVFDKFPEVFFQSKPIDQEKYALIYGRQNAHRVCNYFNCRYLVPPCNFENYKVFLPSSNGSGSMGEALSSPFVGEPFAGATETFISFGNFESRENAENLLKYLKTKYARTLLGTKKVTQGNKKADIWQNVPLQDFTGKSDIDWSKPIPEIDKQLYAKYNLNEEEIAFIESMIKPME